jgi:acetylornithine deacetylase/succinyl-diaminopimelate desuccinylase-like protein
LRPDSAEVAAETIAHLQALIRIPTINPPGEEALVADYLRAVLEREGIECKVVQPAPRRSALFACLHGTGAERPVMLVAHMDVVGVEAEKWSCDPFGGIVRDGYLYGRGAIDDKGMLAVNLMSMLLLKRNVIDKGERLTRDVIFLATPDEEAGGAFGMEWLVANHRELLDAEFAVNEGGRTRVIANGGRYLAIQTAEKISHVVQVTAAGPAGHAAIPLGDNAILSLGKALAKLATYREAAILTPTTRRFFSELARVWPNVEEAAAMHLMVSAEREGELARFSEASDTLATTPVFNAVLRNGISPTILEGGSRFNVIPAAATVTLNVRTLPGESVDAVAARIESFLADPAVTVRVAERGMEAPASDPSSAMFDAMAATAHSLDPEMAVVPYLSTGVTDSARLRAIGVQCFGVLPFPMRQEDEERMHGHDERVPLDSLQFGTQLIYGAISRIGGIASPIGAD